MAMNTPCNSPVNETFGINDGEPILNTSMERFAVYPIRYSKLWRLYKKATRSIWLADEVDLTRDIIDWKNNLNDPERRFLSNVLAFFALSDGIVGENLASRFASEVAIPEARFFYGVQIMMENVHAETYANLITTFITDPLERDQLFHATSHISSINEKAVWALKWINDDTEPFSIRLIAFAAVEGIFFSSSFASIFWMKSRGLLPGMCFSNELISRDEALHTIFACELFRHIQHKPSPERIKDIILEAVNAEKAFATESLPTDLIGMNSTLLEEYIEFVADRLLLMLDIPPYYGTANPFPFMELISTEGKANFFERQVSAYSFTSHSNPTGSTSTDMDLIDFSTQMQTDMDSSGED